MPYAKVKQSKKGNYLKGSGGGDPFADRHEKSYILKKHGRPSEMSRRELLDAKRDYYNYLQLSGGGGGRVEEMEASEKPIIEASTAKPTVTTIHEKGPGTQSEYSKAISKGYFGKGEGSEYISNMPRPEDFGSFEEYNTALRKYKMDNPGKTVM